MTPKAFTELGLVLDIAGAILIFFFGLPEKVVTYGEDSWLEKRLPAVVKVCKYLGLPLLIVGFLCQLIGARFS